MNLIEARLMTSYAGYARERLARALQSAALSADQAARLSAHFLDLLERGERTAEFRAYLK
ncbi:hypothetical protein [Deinococcus sp. QL22]|uniref:hypothetical protein n=1 Tax=Deinococcus sp. QL22 TaxID=2939437 RepID=UPI002016E0B8|nr:hypothetical protein [Deinococcus sp. QL22]UQN08814.1 hypothetical protein M1R55_19610 [Deinococcus sp. QL22]